MKNLFERVLISNTHSQMSKIHLLFFLFLYSVTQMQYREINIHGRTMEESLI